MSEIRVAAVSPFDRKMSPDEPLVGTVLAFQRLAGDGVTILDYVAFRAGNERWYLTGNSLVARRANGLSWAQLLGMIAQWKVEIVKFATGWGLLEITSGMTAKIDADDDLEDDE